MSVPFDDNLLDEVNSILRILPFPFASLTPRLQYECNCTLNFIKSSHIREAAKDLGPVIDKIPALGLTSPEPQTSANPEGKITQVRPHHIIIVNDEHRFTLAGRLSVAKYIGHIYLHVNRQFRTLDEFNDFRKERVGKQGELTYNEEQTREAYQFAWLLCLRRPLRQLRARQDPEIVFKAAEKLHDNIPDWELAKQAYEQLASIVPQEQIVSRSVQRQILQVFEDSPAAAKQAKKCLNDLSTLLFKDGKSLINKQIRQTFATLIDIAANDKTATNTANTLTMRKKQLKKAEQLWLNDIKEARYLLFDETAQSLKSIANRVQGENDDQ